MAARYAVLVATVASAARASSYQNPVYAGDFADPFVLPVDGAYYAYAYVERPHVKVILPHVANHNLR